MDKIVCPWESWDLDDALRHYIGSHKNQNIQPKAAFYVLKNILANNFTGHVQFHELDVIWFIRKAT